MCISRIAPLKGPVEVSVRGCKLALGEEKPQAWTLEVKKDATAEQKAHLQEWLRL